MNASPQQLSAALDLTRRLPAADRAARDSVVTYLSGLKALAHTDAARLLSYLFAPEDAELLWAALGYAGKCKIKPQADVRRIRIDPTHGLQALGLR